MMVPPRSVSCYEIGHAPKADEEDIAYIDGTDDDIEPEPPSAASQRSSIVTSASSRISLISRGTLRSSVDKNEDTKRSKKMVVCRVALLDGSTFEPKGIDKNSDGQIVYDKVVNHLDVIETDYFGLTFRDKTGKKFWLDNSKKISKQVKGGTWVFEFQVKFYPPDPMSLKEDITRYQLCLQVRVDIFNGRLPCSFATYALLGSYTVQAELGDWDPSEYGSGLGYLNDFDFAPTQNQELLEKIQELHQSNKGQTPEVAEAHFLENTKKLAMYGVDMHDVKDSENKPLSLGISANGILVYKDRLRINRFVWPKILKLSYKRNTFYVKIRPSEFEQLERTLGFLCDSHKLAKRLWKTCVEHHAFFRLKTSDPPNSDTLFPRFNTRFRYSGRTAIQARKAAEMQHRDEPHIARTAERRSMVDKSKNQDGGALKKKPVDESDKFDKKQGDPDATLERDHNLAGLDQDGRYAQAPGTGDAADKHGFKGEEPGTEGPPGYAADTSALSDGGKKSKKDKEDEKKRKKEEERKRKEEEKERKRLEKLEKDKKKKAAQETNIDEVTVDPAVLEQKDKEKKHGGGGLFAKLGRKSQKDKEKEVNRPANIPVAVDDHMEQKPKPIQTWALPGMKEMMERRALTNQTEAGEVSVKQELPTIQVDEVENLDPETQEYETDYQSPSAQTGSTSLSDSSAEIENQSDTIIKEEYQSTSLSRGEHSGDTILSEQLKEDYMNLLRETPAITSQSRLEDVKHKIDQDPRYVAVGNDDRRQKWFNEYVDDMLKADFMRLLSEKPTIHSQSTWPEARPQIDQDPRFDAVGDEALREKWFNEYVQGLACIDFDAYKLENRIPKLKSEFMQLLKETPAVHSQSRWDGVKDYLENDPRYQAVGSDPQREAWFDEYLENLKKEEFMQLLGDTPSITSYSHYADAREDISHDPRFHNVDTEEQRQAYFNEYIQNLLKEDYTQLLRETPDITSQSRLEDVKHEIDQDPRYVAVANDDRRKKWFKEYVDDMLKADYMRLLRETPTIHSQSTWPEARQEIDRDPRFDAVRSEAVRQKWFNEYVQGLLKSEFMQLLKETPAVHSQSRWDGVKDYLENDPRYQAVGSDPQREAWFDEYIENLKKDEFMQLLADTPSITSYSLYRDAREDISHDPRFHNVDTEEQRKAYFNEYTQNLKKADFVQLLQDTPDISAQSRWHESKQHIDRDPRYHAVDSDLLRAKWFNEYVNALAGFGYGDVDYGLKSGGFKSIDRKQEFLPLIIPSVATKKSSEEPMPFFANARESEVYPIDRKKVPPPVARKPKGGYDSEEDRLMNNGVPVTVETESYKYNPDTSDVPRSTSNIPIVETKTHKVTYEKDGIPYETEDSILISAHSVTTKSQTIDTTTYKTERDGVIETRVERKITVMTDEDDDLDHDALLRAAIEEVTNMNPDMSVEKIECMRQIEEKR